MAAAVAAHTTFDAKRIQEGLDEGFLDATALAEYLVGKGVPFRQAHQMVGKLVSQCEAQGMALAQAPIDKLKAACGEIEDDVYDHLTAGNVTAGYATAGAGGKKQLADQLTFWQGELARAKQELT